ncbi:Rme1 protein [Candida orthopsilosis Co 90-125]|uniref:Rme1 protein n=1 Tax=Candida orthopsilosis (strain 90-125) TaxID=1136231 RepID=H8WYV0_CANO9|nr:Rme1 protein [Candida orthopsilosis Co 90-125]CCG21582.1 Rme1 protein [Candida orthopsilosis Co 90-125]
MSPLAAILQSYHAKVEEKNPIYHPVKKSGSLTSLSIDEVVVRVPSVSNDQNFTCQSAILLNEMLAQTPKPQFNDDAVLSHVRPVSVLFGAKDWLTDKVTIGFANHHCPQLSTSYPPNSSGFKFSNECDTNDRSNGQKPETSRNPSSTSSLSSANTVVSSIPVSKLYQNPHKAIEQSQLNQIQTDNDLYSLVEQNLRFTPTLYRMSPFAISHEFSIDDTQETCPLSICPWQLQPNKINYSQPTPIHLKLKRGLLENIQDVFNQTVDDDDEGILNLDQQEGSGFHDCIMEMSVPPSTSPKYYSLSRLSSPQLTKLSMFKFTTTPAPPDTFEIPVAPETTPVSNAGISVNVSPFSEHDENNHSDDDIAICKTETSPKSTWSDSSDFYHAATSGLDASRLKDYKKAFFGQYSKASITKVKMAESDKKFLRKNDSKSNYFTLIDNLDIFTCSKFACARRYNCPVKECPMYFLGIKKKAELKHHVHYEHLKNGLVKFSCREYEDEIMKILFVCNEAGCGKAFYRCDSLNRHVNLVHGNRRKGGVKRKLAVVVGEAENVDDEYVVNYDGDSELDNQSVSDSKVGTTSGKRRKLSN